MTKSVIDKALIEQAISALELAQENLRPHGDNCFLHDDGEYNSCFCGLDSLTQHLLTVTLRVSLSLSEPAVEPVSWLHEWADGEKVPMLHGRDNRSHDQPISVTPLYTSPLADVPLLTDDVINAEAAKHQLSTTEERHWYEDNYTVSVNNIKGANDFARVIEQLVLQKAGLK